MLTHWKESYDQHSIFKSRDITLPTKVHLVKAMVFPVVMYGCEIWTIRKAEHRRIDAFEVWCWRRLLRVPWTARRSNQSILKEIGPECSLEALMLKLRLWPPDAKSWLIWKDPDAGKDWGQEEKETTEDEMAGWYHWWLMAVSLSELWELVMNREAWHAAIHGVVKSRIWLSDWTELNWREDTLHLSELSICFSKSGSWKYKPLKIITFLTCCTNREKTP